MNDNAFAHKTTHADGVTVYAAPHELNDEVQIHFPPGYWNESPPAKIEVDLNVGLKSTQQKVDLNWQIAYNRRNPNGVGDKPLFEAYNVYPPMVAVFDSFKIVSQSNFEWPWALETQAGRISFTHAQMVDVMQQFAKLTRP